MPIPTRAPGQIAAPRVPHDGAPTHWLPHEASEGDPVAPGGYWYQPGGYDHGDHCTSTTPCHAFVYFDKAMDMIPAKK